MSKIINVAILGAGNIARSMATAINGLPDKFCFYAVASRSLEKAKQFAQDWNAKIAYGSYEELAKDENVDLIYVATPHSEHYKNTKLCLENGRNCLVEKAFCGNTTQVEELIALAKEKNLLLAEAMWTRYLPSTKGLLQEIVNSGKLGKLRYLEADFTIDGINERLMKPELAGGALLDLGIYPLTIMDMFFGDDFAEIDSDCTLNEYGVDLINEMRFTYKDGRKAVCRSGFGQSKHSNYAKIVGDNGYIVFGPTNVPEKYEIFDNDGKLIESQPIDYLVNGYEFEALECRDAIIAGEKEVKSLPLAESVRIMKWMDYFRCKWGVAYPFEVEADRTHDEKDVWKI